MSRKLGDWWLAALCGGVTLATLLLSCRNLVGVDDKTFSSCPPGPELDACPPNTADCNQCAVDGCEVDLHEAPDHCGRCDRSCLGQSCSDGMCSPEVLRDSDLGPYLYFIVPHETSLYTAGPDFTLVATPKTGGSPTLIAAGVPEVSGMAVRDGYGYLAGVLTGTVHRVPMAGGSLETLTTLTHWLNRVAVDDAFVYVSSHDDGTTGGTVPDGFVAKIPVGGGQGVRLLDGVSCSSIAIDQQSVYVATAGGLQKLDKDGQNPLVLGPAGPRLAIDDTQVYFTDAMAEQGMGDLFSATKLGQDQRLLASKTVSADIVVDDVRVYWRSGDAIRAIRKDGSQPTPDTLVEGHPYLQGTLAIDDTHVYFFGNGNRLYRTPK